MTTSFDCSSLGVSAYLLADGGGPFGALGFATSVQHYQHLLGYELRHLVPLGTRRRTYRRRLVGSIAVAVVAAAVAIIAPPAAAERRRLPHVTISPHTLTRGAESASGTARGSSTRRP